MKHSTAARPVSFEKPEQKSKSKRGQICFCYPNSPFKQGMNMGGKKVLWGINYRSLPKHPPLSLTEERRLLAKAKRGDKAETEELVLRYVGFIIFRIHKKAFPSYVARFGEELLAQAVFILYDKIKTYNLRYRDKNGDFKPVRFSSYIWKRIDGFILDSLKEELARDRRHVSLSW